MERARGRRLSGAQPRGRDAPACARAQVIGVLVRRGNDFAAAEDAVQDALIEAVRLAGAPSARSQGLAHRGGHPAPHRHGAERPGAARSGAAGRPGARTRADGAGGRQAPAPVPVLPSVAQSTSAIALTLRVVGGLTTEEIAEAFLVPRRRWRSGSAAPSAPSRTLRSARRRPRLGAPGPLPHLSRWPRRPGRPGSRGDPPDAAARDGTRGPGGSRSAGPDAPAPRSSACSFQRRRSPRHARRTGPLLWDTDEIAEGVRILQQALAEDRRGEYQLQAAIAALHDARHGRGDLAADPRVVRRAGRVGGQPDRTAEPGRRAGPRAGAGRARSPSSRHSSRSSGAAPLLRRAGYLLERVGDRAAAAQLYAAAARRATSIPERDHLTRRAAALRHEAREG